MVEIADVPSSRWCSLSLATSSLFIHLSHGFPRAVYRWMLEPFDREAVMINVALKKGDYKVVVELACISCSDELFAIRRAYQKRYKHNLEEDVACQTNGDICKKERMQPEDMYVLSPEGAIVSSPSQKPYPNKPPKCSDCAPLFMKAYQMRDAGAVIHSHGMESCLATMVKPGSK